MTWHRNIHQWIFNYTLKKLTFKPSISDTNDFHIIFCVADHFEPYVGQVDKQKARYRVERWVKELPNVCKYSSDSYGNQYKHTMFYPEEQYDPYILDLLKELQSSGRSEVEVHLHHDNDTEDNLRSTLLTFKEKLVNKHKLLSVNKINKNIQYGFIHGNWALDNSHPDGKWCGINNEINILEETGCYADFTLPSAPSATQTKKINSIYYAIDDPQKPKSHNSGTDARVGENGQEGLLIIQGPLGLNWKDRKLGILPKIENGEIGGTNHPSKNRFELWKKQRIKIDGRNNWIFIKLHTHGAFEPNTSVILGDPMIQFFEELQNYLSDIPNHYLHFVSAREMTNIVKAAENNEKGDPEKYRNYVLELFDN
jgi:hypothetical protein